MSLISEALKRARLEAARRESADRGLRYPALPLHVHGAQRSRWPLAASLLAAAALLGAGAGMLMVSDTTPLGAPDTAPSDAPRRPAETTTGESPSAPEGDAPAPAFAAAPEAAAVHAPAPAEATSPGARTPAREPEPPPPVLEVPPEPAPVPPTQEIAPPPASTGALPEHRREVSLPGGGRVVLAGIAWSEEHPVALLNGQPLGQGEVVEGLTVARIRPEGVELRGRGIALFLRLK